MICTIYATHVTNNMHTNTEHDAYKWTPFGSTRVWSFDSVTVCQYIGGINTANKRCADWSVKHDKTTKQH